MDNKLTLLTTRDDVDKQVKQTYRKGSKCIRINCIEYRCVFAKEENNIEKVTINGKEYSIDIEKCKEQGLLIEEKNYPKSWEELTKIRGWRTAWYDVGAKCPNGYGSEGLEENNAFIALGKLIQLRD